MGKIDQDFCPCRINILVGRDRQQTVINNLYGTLESTKGEMEEVLQVRKIRSVRGGTGYNFN